jgi:small subunit ribosomal protein S21
LTLKQISDIVFENKRKEMITLPEVEVKKDEPFESALRRFKKKIEHEGILREVRERKHYEKPSERRRKKAKTRR